MSPGSNEDHPLADRDANHFALDVVCTGTR
jgi:hypothetical protein